ncbi:response regulator transcription factor [Klugiella xanthotipulae]|uniref:LuxR family two component transcriptional regulator n=1 Tax=Klugiella xanthotipulae TaxID=244735 RepID=A0A543I4D1_9MICO|nr:response regulator transcription factor [Klugiella xanthotipulae]TQM65448.1 LuxR family two component transcriptional regulator [Klugiella xanthotipulae]
MSHDVATPALRIAVAEDSLLLREGLTRLFAEAGFVTVGAYGDAVALLSFLESCPADDIPDVVVTDVRMPPTFRDEGVHAAITMRARWPRLGVLLLSQYVESVYAQELLAAGAGGLGYLLKDRIASLDEVRDAIERIARGGTVLDPQVVSELMTRHRDPVSTLTVREREVLGLMAEGLTNRAIAARLFITSGTVEKNVTTIFTKLGLDDSVSENRRVLAVLSWLRD